MKIALDYDGTYTEDKELGRDFILMAQRRGHEVTIVTMRHAHEAITDAPCDVIYTSRQAKGKSCVADIWIDDNPHWIFDDAL